MATNRKSKKIKVEKLYAVIVYDSFISNAEMLGGQTARAIFDDHREAKKFIAEWPKGDEQAPRLVECEVRYRI